MSSGFTLIELMVVVLLIALLAMLAAPSFSDARNDKLVFNYARTVSELIHNARARAAGRGSAHLVVYSKEYGARGSVLVFEALDGGKAADIPPGPNPSSSCRGVDQWKFVTGWAAGKVDPDNRAAIVDALNINSTASGEISVKENILMTGRFATNGVDDPASTDAFVICTTPNGTTYFGTGAIATDAITVMQASTPFTGVAEVDVARHDATNKVVGLNRRVMISGGSAPRIKSQ